VRYGRIVHPDCALCRGTGTVAAAAPEDIDPLVAARAVSMGIGYVSPRFPPDAGTLKKLRDQGLLVDDSPDAAGLVDVPTDHVDRGQVGKKARVLLTGGKPAPFKARTPKPKPVPLPPTPEQQEAERRQEEAFLARWRSAAQERQFDRERAEREERARERALAQLVEAHGEEYGSILDGERAMAAIEDMPHVATRPWMASA
jgi:hypothetical protein